MTQRLSTLKTPLRLLCGVLPMLLLGGCILPSEGSRELQLEPQGKYIRYEQAFAEAYAAPAAEGGYDLILADGLMAQSRNSGTRVFPASGKKVSQVVQMHIAWRPSRGTKSDYPAATNATIRWFVMAGQPAGSEGIIEYRGIGFVKVELDESETLFDIQRMTVKPVVRTDGMRDPLGPTEITGVIRAENNTPMVRRILSELEGRAHFAAPAEAPASQPAGMAPARNLVP